MSGIQTREGEDVLHEFPPTYSAWFRFIIVTLGFGFISAWWMRKRVTYAVTTERVIEQRSSWLRSSTDEFKLDEVQRIRTSESFGEKLLGGGTIVVDTGVDDLKLKGVPNYQNVAQTLRKQTSA